jgi:hypothetical protein
MMTYTIIYIDPDQGEMIEGTTTSLMEARQRRFALWLKGYIARIEDEEHNEVK